MQGRAHLLLLAAVVALSTSRDNLRDTLPKNCGSANFGKPTGTAQRLIETQLKPGVADWNIVVPMPPACEKAEVTGVDMTVCDADAAPEVTMSDALTARVHRTGQLADFAAVNVTVHCIPPAPTSSPAPATTAAAPAPTTTPVPTPTTDARSTYEMFSDELISNEESSDEISPNYLMDYDLTSNELMQPTTTSTTAPPPLPEVTKLQLETTSTTELVTTTRKKKIRAKVKKPRTLKLTIKIAPTHEFGENDQVLKSVGAESASLSNKEKPEQELTFQSPEYSSSMETPPRIAVNPPSHHRRPHRPGSHSLHYGTQYGPQFDSQYGPQPDSQYVPQPDSQYVPQSDSQYGPQLDSQYGPQFDSQYGPQPDSQYGPQLGSPHGPQYGAQFGSQHRPQYGPQHRPQYGAQLGSQHGPQYGPQLGSQHAPPDPQHWLAAQPLVFPADSRLYSPLMSPYSVLGSTRLFGPRLLYWLRHKPTIFFSHY